MIKNRNKVKHEATGAEENDYLQRPIKSHTGALVADLLEKGKNKKNLKTVSRTSPPNKQEPRERKKNMKMPKELLLKL